MAADAAFPHRLAGLFKDLLHFDVLQKLQVAGFVSALDFSDGAEAGGGAE